MDGRAGARSYWRPETTDDPAAFEYGSDCTLLPVGGLDHGHKGYALSILVEVLSAALGGYGRAQLGDDDEANSVFIQVLDPGSGQPLFLRDGAESRR